MITKTPNKFILRAICIVDGARANGKLILISTANGYIVFIFSSIGKCIAIRMEKLDR